MMKYIAGIFCLIAGILSGQVRDDGWRYIVQPADVVCVGAKGVVEQKTVQRGVSPEQCSVILIRYNVRDVPLQTSLNSVIWYKGISSGAGSNPSFSVYAVENNWKRSELTLKTLPEKIKRIGEVTVRANVNGPIPFPVSSYFLEHLKDGEVSLLIEMRSAPGFSQTVSFPEAPALTVAKDETTAYDLQDYLRPVWKGKRIVNETLSPTSYKGGAAEAACIFVPSRVVSVKNYALDVTYEEGTDYEFDGRTLRLTKNSAIPFFKYEELYHNNPDAKPDSRETIDGDFLTFAGPGFFMDKQVAVTYEHNDNWDGPVPQSAEKFLPKTFAKLKAGKPLKLAVFGDSISVGGDASGKAAKPPFMPRWADLVAGELGRFYKSDIDYINPSLGGMRSDWGKNTVDGLVSFEKPDIVIIGFGMNDGGIPFSTEQFMDNTRAMIKSIRGKNPDAEFILLMAFQPNPRWRDLNTMTGYLKSFKKEEGAGVAVADMWTMHEYLLKNKTYWDMTTNHVNHPNDFLHRVYAQVLLAALGVE